MPPAPAVACALVLAHLVAALPALLLDLPGPVRALWLLAVALLGLRAWAAPRVRRLVLREDGGWQLSGPGFAGEEAELKAWLAETWLCVLHFQGRDRHYMVVLTPARGEAGAAQRRLRAMLRLGMGSPRPD